MARNRESETDVKTHAPLFTFLVVLVCLSTSSCGDAGNGEGARCNTVAGTWTGAAIYTCCGIEGEGGALSASIGADCSVIGSVKISFMGYPLSCDFDGTASVSGANFSANVKKPSSASGGACGWTASLDGTLSGNDISGTFLEGGSTTGKFSMTR